MTTKIALVTGSPLSAEHIEKIQQLGFNCINGTEAALAELGIPQNSRARELNQEEIQNLIPEVDTYIYGGLEAADAAMLKLAKNLKHIAFLGTGWNDAGCVDETAARALGIIVTNTPHANAPSVAEMAMSLILSIERAVPAMNAATKKGEWHPIRRRDIAGKTLGIVGLGHIGFKLAQHAVNGFGMKVIYSGPHPKLDAEKKLGISKVELSDLLSKSDFISVHTPAHSTKGLLNAEMLEKMKESAVLINLSAPDVVDAEWLINALEKKRIRGTALDGIYKQPEQLKNRFLALSDLQFLVLPRAAWLTDDSYRRMSDMAIESIAGVINSTQLNSIPNKVL